MRFRDFLKDRIAYIITYFIGISLVILIMSLTINLKVMYLSLNNILYAYFMAIIIFNIFLLYEYLKVNSFYKQLYKMYNSKEIIEEIINIEKGKSKEEKIFINILKKVYKDYKCNIYQYEDVQKQHLYFINQWVHQMKTPVSVINLIVQEENTSNYKEVFDSIGEENEKISQGLNIMLYNARINQFNHDFNVEEIDILLILRKVINDNKKLLIRKKIFPQIIGEGAIVYTDKKWMYFVINQILINAIKYTVIKEKSKKFISFSIEEDVTKITVIIKDNGIGIPKEDLGRVFNAFFTGKNGRKTSESTGMGLYLAKRVCEELGNEIYVKSENGHGTKFFIVFYKGKNIFKL